MGFRVHVRIDAKRDRSGPPIRGGEARQGAKLRLRFHIEAKNALIEREGHFALRLADAGKSDLAGVRARRQRPTQLAFGDDVHAGAEPRQGGEHGLVGIGLDRVADERIDVGESRLEDFIMTRERRQRITIEGGFDLCGEIDEINVFGVQDAVLQLKMMHGFARRLRARDRERRALAAPARAEGAV